MAEDVNYKELADRLEAVRTSLRKLYLEVEDINEELLAIMLKYETHGRGLTLGETVAYNKFNTLRREINCAEARAKVISGAFYSLDNEQKKSIND